MIYRSQDKKNFFCFGDGCTMGVDDWGDCFIIRGFAGSSTNGTLLGKYDDEDCAVLALRIMYDAIGGDEGKMDVPGAEEIRKEVAASRAAAERRKQAAQRRAETEARRKNETSLKAIAPYCWDFRGTNWSHLAEYGYVTIEEVERATDEALLAVRGIGPKAIAKLRSSIEEYRAAQSGAAKEEANRYIEIPTDE